MFKIIFKPDAVRQLRRLERDYAKAALDAVERHLREEPEKPSRTSIRRLRGHQQSTFRLRVQNYRVFYDVVEDRVEVVQILHKSETQAFYKEDKK
jgi:addiction module RelE/StbE family toxin